MNHINKTPKKVNTKSFKEQLDRDYPAYIGMDTHKETIAISVADPGRGKPKFLTEIANDPKKVEKIVTTLSKKYIGEVLLFCYEAGPCGYELYRFIVSQGHQCIVVAPSLIPKKAGDKIKTDKRDADNLTRLLRSGDLTPVFVPNV